MEFVARVASWCYTRMKLSKRYVHITLHNIRRLQASEYLIELHTSITPNLQSVIDLATLTTNTYTTATFSLPHDSNMQITRLAS